MRQLVVRSADLPRTLPTYLLLPRRSSSFERRSHQQDRAGAKIGSSSHPLNRVRIFEPGVAWRLSVSTTSTSHAIGTAGPAQIGVFGHRRCHRQQAARTGAWRGPGRLEPRARPFERWLQRLAASKSIMGGIFRRVHGSVRRTRACFRTHRPLSCAHV